MAVTLPEQAVESLRERSNFAYIEPNGIFKPSDEYADSWGVSHIRAEVPHAYGNKGTGIKIAVIDSGIDSTHPDLDGNYMGGYDFVFNDTDPNDETSISHGTHVSGIIAAEQNGIGVVGVAPEAELYAVKVLDGSGHGFTSWLIAGIEWAVTNQIDIANISIQVWEDSLSLLAACNAAYDAGVLLVAAGKAIVSLSAIREGIRFIIKQPLILSTMVMDFFATFFGSANTLMPIIAVDVLHVGAVAYGWLLAAQALGAMAAALVISLIPEIRRQGMIFLLAVVVFGIATVIFGAARSFLIAMFALIIIGAADAVSTVIRNTIRQLHTPDHIRGRMTGINQIFFMGGPQLGEVEAGLAAQFFGAPFAIVSGGLGCIIALYFIVRRWPIVGQYDGPPPAPAASPAD